MELGGDAATAIHGVTVSGILTATTDAFLLVENGKVDAPRSGRYGHSSGIGQMGRGGGSFPSVTSSVHPPSDRPLCLCACH